MYKKHLSSKISCGHTSVRSSVFSAILTVELLTELEVNNIDIKSMAQDVWLLRKALITCILLSVLAGW